MISASYRNYNPYSNSRNSPTRRQSSRYSSEWAATSSNSNSGSSSSNAVDFIYRGANKHHWAKLQSKIKQRLMHDNISYIEDEVEIGRRSMPPPPADFLAPPAFLETAQDKDERQRQRTETSWRSQKEKIRQIRSLPGRLRIGFPEGHHRSPSHFCKDPSLPI